MGFVVNKKCEQYDSCPFNLCHRRMETTFGLSFRSITPGSDWLRIGSGVSRNNLGSIPTGAFSESKGLISLHMQHCHLREIGAQAFKGLKKLIYLYLSNNEINSIKPGAFEDLTELTYLYLDGNQISDLSEGIFSPMINQDLRWLHITRNKLSNEQTACGGGTHAGDETHEDHPRQRLPELDTEPQLSTSFSITNYYTNVIFYLGWEGFVNRSGGVRRQVNRGRVCPGA
uniref:Chondroadherin n=1 Tax=Mastacembelus armatus TaxID=205130 RepID=A0A7N8YCN7_9TELE